MRAARSARACAASRTASAETPTRRSSGRPAASERPPLAADREGPLHAVRGAFTPSWTRFGLRVQLAAHRAGRVLLRVDVDVVAAGAALDRAPDGRGRRDAALRAAVAELRRQGDDDRAVLARVPLVDVREQRRRPGPPEGQREAEPVAVEVSGEPAGALAAVTDLLARAQRGAERVTALRSRGRRGHT